MWRSVLGNGGFPSAERSPGCLLPRGSLGVSLKYCSCGHLGKCGVLLSWVQMSVLLALQVCVGSLSGCPVGMEEWSPGGDTGVHGGGALTLTFS